MSFLDQLKSQVAAVQSGQAAQNVASEANLQATEAAAKTAWLYLSDLARQLNVLEPDGPALAVEKKVPWPPMKLTSFRADTRKKDVQGRELVDYVSIAWRIVPRTGAPVAGSVSANFPPDLERIEKKLLAGSVKHERVNIRHPEKGSLQAIQFDYLTEAHGGITMTTDHAAGSLQFRLRNLSELGVTTAHYPANQLQHPLLDELAKLIVGQASRFG